MAASKDATTCAPGAEKDGRLDTTMLLRPGSGRNFSGKDSQVTRPITTGWPSVVRLKCAKSSGKCQGSWPCLPITPLRARA